MSDAGSIRVTTVVALDPQAAFELFTKEVDAWWRRGPRFRWAPGREGRMRFEPGVGGRLVEAYGDTGEDVFEVGRVLTWDPASRLVFEFRARNFEPGQVTEVEVLFESAEQGTRVTVEHRGWDTLPSEHPARHGMDDGSFQDMMAIWWADLLASAQRHAAGGPAVRS